MTRMLHSLLLTKFSKLSSLLADRPSILTDIMYRVGLEKGLFIVLSEDMFGIWIFFTVSVSVLAELASGLAVSRGRPIEIKSIYVEASAMSTSIK